MIRIRKGDDGSSRPLEEGEFVEVCDESGKIHQVIFEDTNKQLVTVRAKDPKAKTYARLFGLGDEAFGEGRKHVIL